MPQRILDARQEPLLLLVLPYFQPEFDQHDAGIGNVFFDLRTNLEEALHLLGADKSHDVFNAGAIVPAAVENHDFARRRKMLDVALQKHLRLFAIGGRRQRHHPEDARADAFGDGLDRAALAGRVATFKHDDDPCSLGLGPVLHVAKLDLKLAQLLFVGLALHPAVVGTLVVGHGGQLPKITRRNRLIAKKK